MLSASQARQVARDVITKVSKDREEREKERRDYHTRNAIVTAEKQISLSSAGGNFYTRVEITQNQWEEDIREALHVHFEPLGFTVASDDPCEDDLGIIISWN
jgi:hypothetical protein